MAEFDWKDLLTLSAVIIGAILSARQIPGFPSNNNIAKFTVGIHVTVVVAIFTTMATPSIDIWSDVSWIKSAFNFALPLLIYAIIITMGMALLLNSTYQTIIIKVHQNKMYLVPTAIGMFSFDMFVLIHLMCIF